MLHVLEYPINEIFVISVFVNKMCFLTFFFFWLKDSSFVPMLTDSYLCILCVYNFMRNVIFIYFYLLNFYISNKVGKKIIIF